MDYEEKYRKCAATIILLTDVIDNLQRDLDFAVKIISELPDEMKREILNDPAFPDGINPCDRKYFLK